MYISKYQYKCMYCKQSPTVMVTADCGGDAIGPFCKSHTQEYFQKIMKSFEDDEDNQYKPLNNKSD